MYTIKNMEDNNSGVAEYLQKLCKTLSTNPESAYELALSYLSTTGDRVRAVQDEKILCQKIYYRLASVSQKDADRFNECYMKIKNSFVLKQRAAILNLLLALSDNVKPADSTHQLFPIPSLQVINPSGIVTQPSSSSSKSTLGTPSCPNLNSTLRQDPSSTSLSSRSNMAIAVNANEHLLERQCVRDAVLAATGVKTRGATPSRPQQIMSSRIAHLGFLHDRLKEFMDPASGLMPQGLMGEGLVTAIRDDLTDYYRSIALLQSVTSEGDGVGGATLRRVSVWALEPLHRLTWLANIAHAAHHKKGGELASCVHRFVRHGDERVSALARKLLTALTYPLLLMLTRWLIHGEIDDPFNEFFIECRSGVPIDRMWHDKYRVREWMVPSLMSGVQAAQILATGKSVVFLREACAGADSLPDHANHLRHLLTAAEGEKDPESAWWEASGLRDALSAAHGAAASRLVGALTVHHHLPDHLAAHRRYLLLAQGDFVHHLMTLLQEELCKPATSLYVHNLTCTLESAVRATNAQFEPPHVLARLHVNLYPNCDGRGGEDSGWDVFALQYRVDGPLGTLFPPSCAARYRALFTQLWRVKRTEYALHDAWRKHAILHKRLKFMPEVIGLLRRVSCLRAEALRVCGALQEAAGVGAEAAWRALLAAVEQGEDLDHLIQLHTAALDRQAIDAIIHHSTQELQSYLGNVLNETLALCSFEGTLHAGIDAELERRARIEQLKAERVARGEYAFTAADEAQDKEKRKIFLQFLASRKADLNVWARTYRSHITTLILKLALHSELSLQTLAFRLDYSDYYKRGDAKLHEPLTYQHKRLSEIGMNATKLKAVQLTCK